MADNPSKPKRTKAEKKAMFRKDFVEPIKSRREVLKEIMRGNEKDRERKARDKNFEFFEEDLRSGMNIYGMAIDMIKSMPDRGKTGGQNLAIWYLEDFGKWLEQSGREEQFKREFLEGTIQMNALKYCEHSQKALVSKIFDISAEKLKEDVTSLLEEFVKKHEFVNAANMAIQHELVNKYRFEELALPLILSNQEKKAYEMMRGHPRLQRNLVEFLDNLVGKPTVEVEDALQKYKDDKIMTITTEKFVGKTLDKFISTVIGKNVEDYDFDQNLTKSAPNYARNAQLKAMKFNIAERYEKSNNSDDNYFQHMRDTLEKTPEVRENILFYLWDSKETEKQIDAISLAIHLGINSCGSLQIPGLMRDFFRAPDSRLEEAQALLERRRTLQVPEAGKRMYVFEEEKKYEIHMIKNGSDLSLLCSQLKHLSDQPEHSYVGFDSEWKPSHFSGAHASKIAIIQLFFNDTVYLVDCVELEEKQVSPETWGTFASRLLQSEKLRVIGFDMRNDLDAIASIPALKGVLKMEQVKNCWDLKRLTENVCDVDMEILELPKKTFKLADLTQHFLDIKLDKTEQCSNWQSRPLRKNQIVYAAMDAVVVVEIYEKIIDITMEKSTSDIQKLVNDSNVMAPKKEKSSNAYRKLKNIPWIEIYQILQNHRNPRKPLRRPHEIKVIVDTMLLGFGKHLRRIGIDVVLPRDVQEFREKLKTMSRLGGEYQRHIITVPSKSYEALKTDYEQWTVALPELNSKPPIDQLIAFCDAFNVDLRPEDEYLRCIECNSRLQIKFPSPVLHFLHQYCVIHVQNVYRADMSEFPLEDWFNQMLRIDPREYDGIKVEMSRPREGSNWIVATVPTGCLHITRQLAIHTNLPEGVEVRVHKVPDDEFQRPNLCFYVCGDCGTVGYDGRANNPSSQSNSAESIH